MEASSAVNLASSRNGSNIGSTPRARAGSRVVHGPRQPRECLLLVAQRRMQHRERRRRHVPACRETRQARDEGKRFAALAGQCVRTREFSRFVGAVAGEGDRPAKRLGGGSIAALLEQGSSERPVAVAEVRIHLERLPKLHAGLLVPTRHVQDVAKAGNQGRRQRVEFDSAGRLLDRVVMPAHRGQGRSRRPCAHSGRPD